MGSLGGSSIAAVPLLEHLLDIAVEGSRERDGIQKGGYQSKGGGKSVDTSRAIDLCREAGDREKEEEGYREELEMKLHQGGG